MAKPSIFRLHSFSERNLIRLGAYLADKIRKDLVRKLKTDGLMQDPAGVKDMHGSDLSAYHIIHATISGIKLRGVVEGMPDINPYIASPILFIDPVDGSRNWERQVGDPAFAMAYCEKAEDAYMEDLSFAYVEGLLSGDKYYTLKGKVWYRSALLNQKWILPKLKHTPLNEATAYVKPGYTAAEKVLKFASELMKQCKDIRAFDNSSTELCQFARGAADLIVEARDLSDFHNLLAYPILTAVGATVTDLHGIPLDKHPVCPGEIVNFLVFSSKDLQKESMQYLKTQ
jgi:fructose-1,6-bisphosphatase/inositol monophosphatase family enzyme